MPNSTFRDVNISEQIWMVELIKHSIMTIMKRKRLKVLIEYDN